MVGERGGPKAYDRNIVWRELHFQQDIPAPLTNAYIFVNNVHEQ
jgi:hypothetical protein